MALEEAALNWAKITKKLIIILSLILVHQKLIMKIVLISRLERSRFLSSLKGDEIYGIVLRVNYEEI